MEKSIYFFVFIIRVVSICVVSIVIVDIAGITQRIVGFFGRLVIGTGSIVNSRRQIIVDKVVEMTT